MKGGHIVISVSVHPFVHLSVRSFVTDYFCWRVVVCVRFSFETTWPNSPMLLPIYWGNNIDLQHILHFDVHPSMTAGQGDKILQFCAFLDVWRVIVCVRFSYETTRPNSPMLMPIYRGNNVDLQHTLHFDLHPSMTAGQGCKILQLCKFRLLP